MNRYDSIVGIAVSHPVPDKGGDGDTPLLYLTIKGASSGLDLTIHAEDALKIFQNLQAAADALARAITRHEMGGGTFEVPEWDYGRVDKAMGLQPTGTEGARG